MITIALAFLLLTSQGKEKQEGLFTNYHDTLPQKNIDKLPSKQRSIPGKVYCCSYCRTKYEIKQRGNQITIISIYKERRNTIHGIVKNGKIYSDDPNEKNLNRPGMLYSLKNNIFRVKNAENGDYEDYILCR